MDIDEEKYYNTILFFAENIPTLGRTKLNKLLYFLDFDHFEKYGKAVTGDEYENKDLGPVPVHAESIIEKMVGKGLANISGEAVVDFIRYAIRPKVCHDPRAFSPTEMEMLYAVKARWEHHTAREMVIASHGEAPWLATKRGELIPHALAYYRSKYEEPACEYDVEFKHAPSLVVDTPYCPA